jgi:hypothetical protein
MFIQRYYNSKIRDFNDILGQTSKTTMRKGKERMRYCHLLKHRFDFDEKIKIQREDDNDIISDKVFNFSYDTID